MSKQDEIKKLLANPDNLKKKKPFTRGMERGNTPLSGATIDVNGMIDAVLPSFKKKIVSQEQFLRELDPYCHDVLFDENIPSVCVKVQDDNYVEIKYKKVAIPFQLVILLKQVMHLTTNRMDFTLTDLNPTERNQENFILFKQYWDMRNMDGMKKKMVQTQLSQGDAGLLFYFNDKKEIKCRILSYADGYVLCPHNDQNGERILESVYYIKDDVEYIDSYDDMYMYRYSRKSDAEDVEESGWVLEMQMEHGFDEIPLITKRGEVAWNNSQTQIEDYEELHNVFMVIQKKHGWGILYIKGKFKNDTKQIAGNVILNDTSLEGKGDAKFLTPPSPEGIMDTLDKIFEQIQISSLTTILLPKDIKMSGDISGIAIMLSQALDIENASLKVVEWQNVADKMVRLFKQGLAKELVNKGKKSDAITEFADLYINGKFTVWKPLNEYEFNQMLTTLVGANILSRESGIELNTMSKPDEKKRVEKQLEEMQNELEEKVRLSESNANKTNDGSKPIEPTSKGIKEE